MKIEVFGTGCPKCRKTEETIAQTIRSLGIEGEIVHIDKLDDIINRGVMMTPAVAIDGVIKLEGKVPTEQQIRAWFSR